RVAAAARRCAAASRRGADGGGVWRGGADGGRRHHRSGNAARASRRRRGPRLPTAGGAERRAGAATSGPGRAARAPPRRRAERRGRSTGELAVLRRRRAGAGSQRGHARGRRGTRVPCQGSGSGRRQHSRAERGGTRSDGAGPESVSGGKAMGLTILQVDAFTDRPFGGNPAAVCLLTSPRDESWLQAVAREMNLSETAFVTPAADGFDLRWFTPT